jgi:hypothetical protein
VTAPDVPHVFPLRYHQPSAVQGGEPEGWSDNPLDDQNTVCGLTVTQDGGDTIFVTERERRLVRQLSIAVTPDGKLTYRLVRTFLSDTSFAPTEPGSRTAGHRAARQSRRSRDQIADAPRQ